MNNMIKLEDEERDHEISSKKIFPCDQEQRTSLIPSGFPIEAFGPFDFDSFYYLFPVVHPVRPLEE